ncbi:hypothetical protein E1K05_19055 [Salmonella enterica subsp. enterica serovar Kisangani]|nr:hypothetical protein [Salmonella enterica subsp. enterica serovar Kisangani]EEA9152641.1 hypothetical protein [Salmonella enterica subsp. enterica]EBW1638378.1 hypothetical protein [Salmonella enterica subsp. enterica serovar Kisangani]ECB2408855.1 hypothetical protein [Salmonella enterica subsp. enterica serovar Kisangani]ECG5519995.1 hypothetical protein [Salmonella enterica subsp. enterica serovar Kisangani]
MDNKIIFVLFEKIEELTQRVEALEEIAAEYVAEQKVAGPVGAVIGADEKGYYIPTQPAPEVDKGLINQYIDKLYSLSFSTMGNNTPDKLKIQFAIQHAIDELKAEIA